ncbi:tRNA (adenosine(37)-N6)-dimethylallyltransferase MiaA [Microbacterium sp. YY-01]|uniref:tRNA (adenosine(37)-N6)-dimethylallyltransferase MiaA n=1 Tax=Microbacterium sp. YY-01 TaxID=3421634 RepID=UPI003D17F0B5
MTVPARANTGSRRVWAVIGATGTGKSDLAVRLAEHLRSTGNPAQIVNSDAMQFYRGMDIGTAKLSMRERRGIPHHLFDVRDVSEEAAVAWYQPLARTTIDKIHQSGGDAIVVGGSGLYVSSAIYNFRFPPRDAAARAHWEQQLAECGPGVLYAELQKQDPATAERIDPRNVRRLIRALEVLAQGQKTHGAALPQHPEPWYPMTTIIGLHVERAELVQRLDERVRRIWRDGIVEETARLRTLGLEQGVTASRAIGYAQALAQLDGHMTQDEAITLTQTLTRRYARRQVSWFRRYPGIRWHEPTVAPETLVSEAADEAS